MASNKIQPFFDLVRDILDDDLKGTWEGGDVMYDAILLLQIVRLLKDKGPEEKSSAVKGFGV